MHISELDYQSSICIIPARGGSKRVPKKNVRIFCGKPMIHWSINAAQQSNCFDRIIVSTDDPDIAQISLDAGAEIPFYRPQTLANDFAGTREVIVHAIDSLVQDGYRPSAVCCLYATAPFVTPLLIRRGLELLYQSHQSTVVFTAASFPTAVDRALKLNDMGYATPISPSSIAQRSQDLDVAFHDAGQFYWANVDRWANDIDLLSTGRALVLPRWSAVDIDTEEDWYYAELLYELLAKRQSFPD